MIKISTLFKKDPNDLGRVINEINPSNMWVYEESPIFPTQKFDGTAAMVKDGSVYKRYDVKAGREVPKNSIPCQEPDAISGHWPHWVLCDRTNPQDKIFFEAFDKAVFIDGTYELCGPKINRNPEKLSSHELLAHGSKIMIEIKDYSFETIKEYLSSSIDIEGIVFHGPDGKMCKIRKRDFGVKRTA